MANLPPAISVSRLFRDFGRVQAVAGVDLTVAPGEVYAFIGPNGAGKTTTLRILSTLLLPTSGQAFVAGHDVVADAGQVRLKIGTALQDVGLDPKQTGLELLRRQGALYGLSRRETAQRIGELENLIDIGDALGRLIETYSRGMKRRLDLAASLIHSPQVLFLDEPTTGLDPISRSRVCEYVRHVNREQGVSIFLTTQYLEEADALADRVGIINHGMLAAEGTSDQLKKSVGSDVIVASVSDARRAQRALVGLTLAMQTEAYESELAISTADGASQISQIALALNRAGVTVKESLNKWAPADVPGRIRRF